MDSIYDTSEKKVSLIVPIYNSQGTLSRCIDSLLRQTYSQIEIILVNDGSTDDSLMVCRRYENNCSVFVVNKPNGGVSSARNAGLDVASGAFIMFVDSDDWVEPDYCETFVRCFEKDSLVFSNPSSVTMRTGSLLRMNRDEALLLRGEGIESPVSKLFEMSVIKQNQLRFQETLSLGEDYIFVLHYLCCITGDLLRLECSAYHYELQEGESLSKKIPSCEQTEFFYKELSEAARKLKISDSKSHFILERSCMMDFEKLISSDGQNRSISFAERYHRILRTMSCNAYKKTCHVGVGSQNRIYELLYKKRMALLLSAYFACR